MQDDLAVLVEGSDGMYYLQAGAIVLPGTSEPKHQLGYSLRATDRQVLGVWKTRQVCQSMRFMRAATSHYVSKAVTIHSLFPHTKDGHRPREVAPQPW